MALFKKICIVLGVFVLIFTTVLYILTTPYGENIIRGVLENELRKVFGQQVSISSFETNLLSRVQVYGFAITRISGAETHPFVSIEYARVTYRLWHLLIPKPAIDSVTIDKLSVSVVRDSSGFQLPYSRKEKNQGNVRKPLDFGLKFGLLDLRNSSFAYNDRTIPVHASAGDVDVYIREKNDSAYGFKLEAGSWEIVYHDYPVTVDSLTMSGYLTQDEIGIEHLDLSLPDLHCSLKTTVRMSSSPFLINGDMSIQGNIIPIAGIFHDKIPSWLNPQRGIMNTHIRFTGTPRNPDITLSMDVHELQFKDTLINNVTLMGVYSEHTLRLKKMQLGMLDGIISGEGEINADSLLSHDFSLTLNGINLQYVWELFYKDSSPYRGRLNGMLQTRGPLKIPRDLNASAHLSLE